jgi:hypothetical protein
MSRPQKITFGEMRESGVRGILIYCSDYHCSHHVTANADQWPAHIRLSGRPNGKLGISRFMSSSVISYPNQRL